MGDVEAQQEAGATPRPRRTWEKRLLSELVWDLSLEKSQLYALQNHSKKAGRSRMHSDLNPLFSQPPTPPLAGPNRSHRSRALQVQSREAGFQGTEQGRDGVRLDMADEEY